MWVCGSCGANHDQQVEACSSCGAWRSVGWREPQATTAMPPRRARGELLTARDLARMDVVSLPLSPDWRTFLGGLAPQFSLLNYSPPGEGKTTFLILFSAELAKHGDVLFVAAEEGQSNSMIQKLNRLEVHSQHIHISSAVTTAELLADLAKIQKPRFLIIDSLACFPISLTELSELTEEKRLGVAFSAHSLKSRGGYRGGSEWGHYVDIVIRAERGRLILEKNRFGPLTVANFQWPTEAQEVKM